MEAERKVQKIKKENQQQKAEREMWEVIRVKHMLSTAKHHFNKRIY